MPCCAQSGRKAKCLTFSKLEGRWRTLSGGSLDYDDDLLRKLDYTVCSIHSRFSFGKQQQTERILRVMDNRCFNILGHATGGSY